MDRRSLIVAGPKLKKYCSEDSSSNISVISQNKCVWRKDHGLSSYRVLCIKDWGEIIMKERKIGYI